jgi:general stress protein 26
MMSDKLTLKHVADEMKGIDIAILSTRASEGGIACRPMSNNGDVEYDGTSFFFSYDQASCISDIECEPHVALGYSSSGLIGGSVYIAVEGLATLIRDRSAFEKHWTAELDVWFEDGIDTPGLVLIQVKAHRIKIWERNTERELVI